MSAYLTAVLADSPIHYWRLADSGGLVAHDIGSIPVHLFNQTPGLGYSGPVSDGGSFTINSTYSGLASGDPLGSFTSPFSIEGWLWPIFTPNFNWWIATVGSGSGSIEQVYLTSDKIQSFVSGAGQLSTNTYAVQHWHHLVMTYDGTTVRQYVDGALDGTAALAGPVTIHNVAAIGWLNGSSSGFFEGNLSEFAIYTTALSAARVLAHFNAADQVSQAPVFGAASGTSGGGTNPNYTSLLQAILQSVRTTFENGP